MRHYILSGAVATTSLGMFEATFAAHLVASAGLALGLTSRLTSTVAGAIDLTVIAVAADQHLGMATDTQKKAGSRFHRHVRVKAETWTKSISDGILCPH